MVGGSRDAAAGTRRPAVADAYDAFARNYDDFTAHHNYEAWTADLERLAKEAGLRGTRQLDIACGTGKSFLPFLERGYEVSACDISPAMLERALLKADGRVALSVQDMRALPRLGSFDLVTCLDDAVNYCLTEDELIQALHGVRRNLDPDGVALFDTNTLAAYRAYYHFATVIQAEGTVLVWDGRTSSELAAGEIAQAAFVALERRPDGWWSRAEAMHRQRHYPEEAVRAALAAAGLECAASYGMTLDGSFSEEIDDLKNSKAVYIARHRTRATREGR